MTMNRLAATIFAAFLLATVTTPAVQALTCNPSGKYCGGTYAEIVQWERHFNSGSVHINPTQAVKDVINSTGTCALHLGAYILVPAGSVPGERMLDRLLIAKQTGEVVRVEWRTGASGSCELFAILLYSA